MGCCDNGGGCGSLACRVATASYTAQSQGKCTRIWVVRIIIISNLWMQVLMVL